MFSKTIVGLNSVLLRLRSPKCPPESLLMLIPSCLQSSECSKRVTVDTANCARCGRCPVGAMLDLADEYGIRAACATGGRLALELVKDDSVRAVVAVACEKELRAGIMGAFPKPVFAVCNRRPNGPCKDTTVDEESVRRAIESVLESFMPDTVQSGEE